MSAAVGAVGALTNRILCGELAAPGGTLWTGCICRVRVCGDTTLALVAAAVFTNVMQADEGRRRCKTAPDVAAAAGVAVVDIIADDGRRWAIIGRTDTIGT